EPGEVEAALRAHASVREAVVVARHDPPAPARLVAYVVPADGVETDADALRAHLAARLPAHLVPSAIVPISRIPLTPNGKVDRRALPAPAPEPDHAGPAPGTPAEEALARVWAQLLHLDEVGTDDSFFALGGDSILAIQMVTLAAREGYRISPRDVFQHPTVAGLARVAVPVETEAAPAAAQGPATGSAPLLPIQRWFFERFGAERHWNMAAMLTPAGPVDAGALEHALAAVLEHHDALRLRFARGTDGGWTQGFAAPGGEVPLEEVDLSWLSGGHLSRAIEGHALETHGRLDLEEGPITRMALYRGGEGEPDRLLWVVHHLAVDAVSWSILLEDLSAAYAQAADGEPVRLPPRTTPYGGWAERLAELTASAELREEAEWWTGQPWERAAPLPAGAGGGAGVEADAETVHAELDEETTRVLLQEVPPVYGTQVNDVLLAALARALSRWTGGRAVAVELEGHGREELAGVDLTRTVGWFTTAFPVLLDASAADAGALLRETKERLRAVPRKGLGFGVLRWLADEEVRRRMAALPEPEVSFNYLGQGAGRAGGGWLRGARESSGPQFSPGVPRPSAVQVLAAVRGGRLGVSWSYPGGRWPAAEVERAARAFVDTLREMAAHCRAAAGGYTPSDFPLAQVDQPALDRALAEVGAGARGTVEDVYPLTPLQEGILFHALEREGTGAYVVAERYPLHGSGDGEALAEAFRALVAHHPVLRTAFAWRGLERPLQVVLRSVDLPVDVLDWRDLSPGVVEEKIAGWKAAERARGFAPDRAPLTRLALARTGEQRWEMLWSLHHLVSDGWSLPRLLEDLAELFRASGEGREPQLARRRPFRDHVALLGARDPAAAEAFWRRELEDFAGATPLPPAPAPGRIPSTFAEARRILPRDAAERLRAKAAAAGVTLPTLFQGALALLLARYTGEDDVAFGNVVSGRPPELEGAEEMVGMMIATLPVRARVPSMEPAAEWLRALQARQAEARQHDHAPLVEMRRWAGVEGGRDLFEALFVFENYPGPPLGAGGEGPSAEELAAAGLAWEAEGSEPAELTSAPVTLAVAPTPIGTKLRLTYDAGRFAPAAMRRVLDHLLALAHALPDAGERPLGEVEMTTAEERAALVAAGSAQGSFPGTRALPALFAEQAARTPDALALTFGEESVTYTELDARANRIAHRLIALGARPDALVGLCVERSVETVVGILAILKSGAGYLPLDPAYPEDRLAYMLEDSGAPIVVTTAVLRDRLPAGSATVLCLQCDAAAIAAESPEAPEIDISPESLAYVIYTSGSTGKPKGVEVTHANVVRLFSATDHWFGFGAQDVWTLFHSYAFDFSVWEIWGALLYGGRLVVVPFDVSRSPEEFYALLEREAVTVLNQTPSAFRQLMRADEEAAARGEMRDLALRHVVFGGEALEPATLRGWVERRGDEAPRLVNMYGITETTVHVTYRAIRAADTVDGSPSPIGIPIPDLSVHLLDRDGQLVPAGVVGEMYVGGAGVARGYLGR
ncbi:MAG TPA: amino acid adenylation domain-containing protein, partial [Longimicrobiaceae bacterium]|nr:amino acid adenylation domain-containing protein [Longimicrobiaceae bacterium]